MNAYGGACEDANQKPTVSPAGTSNTSRRIRVGEVWTPEAYGVIPSGQHVVDHFELKNKPS